MSTDGRWWRKYRAKRYNRPRLNKEQLIRTSLTETLKEYLTHCSFPGVRYLVDPQVGKKERCCWAGILLTVSSLLVYSIHVSWTEVLAKPLIVSMESTVHHIRNIDFPAVAFCNINRISKRAAKEEALTLKQTIFHNHPLEKLEKYMEHLGRLIDFETGNEEIKSLLSDIPLDYILTTDVAAQMKKLAPKCEDMMLFCTWNGEVYPCKDLFTLRRTAHGHCCCFNYIMDFNEIGRRQKFIPPVKRQVHHGYHYGLNVMLDLQLDDYAYPLRNTEGIDILLFDTDHFADHNNGILIHRIIEANSMMSLEIQSREQIATKEVAKYSLDTRKCLFHDELPEDYGDKYSYSSCILACRILTIQSLCKCVPYFLPGSRNVTPECTVADIYCLNKYKEKFMYLFPMNPKSTIGLEFEIQDGLYCPSCYPDCEYIRHFSRVFDMYINMSDKDYYLNRIRDEWDGKNKSFVAIFYPTADSVLDRLDVVFYWYELLSNFGGVAGLLIGYCVVTSIEVVYYVMRFFKLIKEKISTNQ